VGEGVSRGSISSGDAGVIPDGVPRLNNRRNVYTIRYTTKQIPTNVQTTSTGRTHFFRTGHPAADKIFIYIVQTEVYAVTTGAAVPMSHWMFTTVSQELRNEHDDPEL